MKRPGSSCTVAAFILLSALMISSCGDNASSGVGTTNTELSNPTDSPNSDSTVSTTASTKPPTVESPFFSGSLELVDNSGWIYSVEIPPLEDIFLEVKKDLASAPPGEASTAVVARFGNIGSVEILPNTPGRNPPEVKFDNAYVFRLLDPPEPSVRFQAGVGYKTVLQTHFGDQCRTENTDFDPLTNDSEVPIQNLLVSALVCSGDGEFFRIDDETSISTSEPLVDRFIELVRQGTLGVILEFSNNCFLALDETGSYYMINYELDDLLVRLGVPPRIRPMPWDTSFSFCQVS